MKQKAKKRKLIVTVAIPAHNEEANIVNILKEVTEQKQTSYEINEILLVSDGSTDKTVELAKKLKINKLRIIDSKIQLGKIKRFNQILKLFKGDVLVQLDADMHFGDKLTLEKLIKPFKEKSLGMTCSYHYPVKPQTFVEQIAFFGFKVWDRARSTLGKKGDRYFCEGGLRAFSKKYVQSYDLPELVPMTEDVYSYYFAVLKGLKVKVIKSAKIYFRLPANFSDYIKQMNRFRKDPDYLEGFLGEELIAKYAVMTNFIKIKALFRQFIYSPIIGIFFILVMLYIRIESFFYKPEIVWRDIKSTKKY